MAVLHGRIRTREEALVVATSQAGCEGTDPRLVDLFVWWVAGEEARSSARAALNRAIHGRYGPRAPWRMEGLWVVPVPLVRYVRWGVHTLVVEVETWGVAQVTVDTDARRHQAVAVERCGKQHKVSLPLTFLAAVLDRDTERFLKAEKSGPWTGWDVPGVKGLVWLHDGFVEGLCQMLAGMSLGQWLGAFGGRGEAVAPLMVGDLMPIYLGEGARALLPAGRGWSREEVLAGPAGLGYCRAEVEVAIQQAEASGRLRPGIPSEEPLRVVLPNGGKDACLRHMR